MTAIEQDLMSLLGGALASGPNEVHDKTDVGHGITVSTVDTTDRGWETAIVDADGEIHVVEEYPDRDAAAAGHAKWVEQAPTLTHVTDIGYGSLIEPSERELVREAEEVPA